MTGKRIVSMKFRPVFENVDAARNAVYTACREYYPDPESGGPIDELMLAITEAMNNAVEHSGTAEVEIDVAADGRNIVFRMITAGARFDPTADVAFPEMDTADDLPEGGFGRALIREMSDSVHYVYNGGRNILTLNKIIIYKEDRANGS